MDKLVVLLICFVFCVLVGCTIGCIINPRKKDGLFILDESDPDTTRWILDVKMDPDEIKNKKEIRLKVCKMDKQEDV